MIWLMTVCTSGWVICGQQITNEYPTEEQCYRSMESMYKQQGKDAFNYITCAPKKGE